MLDKLRVIRQVCGWCAAFALVLTVVSSGTPKWVAGASLLGLAAIWVVLMLVALPRSVHAAYEATMDYLSQQARTDRRAEADMRSARTMIQSRADHAAQQAVAVVNPCRYSLLLRPFADDGRLLPLLWLPEDDGISITTNAPSAALSVPLTRWTTLEGALDVCMADIAPLHAIEPPGYRRWLRASWGRPGHFSPGRASWQETITGLMQRACVIFVLPGMRPGIRWEITQIARSPVLLRKTLFVLGPFSGVKEDREWQSIRRAVRTDAGIVLPDAEEFTQCITLREGSGPGETRWQRSAPFHRLSDLNAFLAQVAALSGLDAAAAPQARLVARTSPAHDPLWRAFDHLAPDDPTPGAGG